MMRWLKAVLAILLLGGMGVVWDHHEPVLAAYQREAATDRLQLRGVDLDQRLTDVGPSPYLIPVAADGRQRATALSVAEPEPPSPARPRTMFGGFAALTGSVAGPAGPEVGANVRIERHGPDGVSSTDVVTDDTGSWEVAGLAGGRFRVRAWSEGGLAMERSEVLFLDDDGGRRLDLLLVAVSPDPRAAFTTRGDVYLGLTASVAVSMTEHTVNADGVVEISPIMGGQVSLPSAPGFTITPAVAVTDGSGVARFTVRCHRVGSGRSTISYLDWRGSVALPPCVPRPGQPSERPTPAPAQTPITLHHMAGPTEAAVGVVGDRPVPVGEGFGVGNG